jgi:hypothetical protein
MVFSTLFTENSAFRGPKAEKPLGLGQVAPVLTCALCTVHACLMPKEVLGAGGSLVTLRFEQHALSGNGVEECRTGES